MKQLGYRHIFGSSRTHATAVFVMEYIKDRFAIPHTNYSRDKFVYEPVTKLGGGTTSYNLIIDTNECGDPEKLELMIEASRAFIAARGDYDIWA